MVIWWACATVPTAPAWPAAHRRVRKYLRDRSRGRRAVGRRGGSRLAGRCGSSRRGGPWGSAQAARPSRRLKTGIGGARSRICAAGRLVFGRAGGGRREVNPRVLASRGRPSPCSRFFWGGCNHRGAHGCCTRCGPRRDVAAAESLPLRNVPVGVLRLIEERICSLVQHGGLRESRESASPTPEGCRRPAGALNGSGWTASTFRESDLRRRP